MNVLAVVLPLWFAAQPVNLHGLQGQRGATGLTGPASTVPGPTGPAGAAQPAYTLPPATAATLGGVKVGTNLSVAADGTLAGPKLFFGSGVTLASGQFTATISPACATAPTLIQVTAKAPGTALSNQVSGSWTSSTATTVSGLVTTPATLTVVGLTVVPPPAGTPVSVLGLCP